MDAIQYSNKRVVKRYLVVTFLLFLILQGCNPEDYGKEVNVSTDLERVSGEKFKSSSSLKLKGGQFQSDEMARSGSFSIKLNAKNNKGLEGSIENIKVGDEIHIQVWRAGKDKENGVLHLSAGYMYAFDTKKAVRTEGEWELLEFDIVLPVEFPGKGLAWYVLYEGSEEVYFDDLSVSIKRNNGLQIQSHENLPFVNLTLPLEGLVKIESKRAKALEDGILISESEDWVKGRMDWNDENKKVKVRLKGDWTDHLYGEKFSLRTNVLKGKTLGSYSKFGIQKPGVRYYLDEWFIHQILMEEEVLTTRYEFIDFYINNESKGLYAVEEHFTNEMLISQGRKEGMIFKYSEDELWLTRYKNEMNDIPGVPWYEASIIDVFSFDDILENEKTRLAYFTARDLLYQHQFKLASPHSYIDVKKMACYLALMDLCGGYHSLVWHNRRFYFNETTKLIEPVVYDVFQENSRILQASISFLGLQYVQQPKSYQVKDVDFLFQDSVFVSYYTSYLTKYSNPTFFERAENKYKPSLDLYEKEIQREYDFYSFDLSLFEERAEIIRGGLEEFNTQIKKKLKEKRKPSVFKINVPEDYFPIKNVSIQANLSFDSGKTELQLWNFYFKEIEIVGLVIDNEEISFKLPNRLPAYKKTRPPKVSAFTIDNIPNSLRYKVVGQDSVYTQKITKYRLPKLISDEEKSR